jgi:ubiquinone/menaquinone biosynthesis C-methylase UbiE
MFSRNSLFLPFRWRGHLVGKLTGDVLEVGVGTGTNLAYYSQAARLCAVEPDPERAALARQTAQALGLNAEVKIAPAEALPYADGQFDHVVCSLVLCSVTDQRLALAEIGRVLKPTGTIHLVEHVRPQSRWLAWLFARLTPWWQKVAHNCHLDRQTIQVLEAAGWRVHLHQRRWAVVRMSATRRK